MVEGERGGYWTVVCTVVASHRYLAGAFGRSTQMLRCRGPGSLGREERLRCTSACCYRRLEGFGLLEGRWRDKVLGSQDCQLGPTYPISVKLESTGMISRGAWVLALHI